MITTSIPILLVENFQFFFVLLVSTVHSLLTLHSRDTILAVLLWIIITHYSSFFQYFFDLCYVPTLVENLAY